MSERVYLVGGVRTPVGKYGGALSSFRPDDLAAEVIAELLNRTGILGEQVDEVIFGAANQSGEDNRNLARMAGLLAGLPMEVPGYTVNRLCASGLQAVASAADQVRAGSSDIVVAGGAESMTRAPWVMSKPAAAWAKPGEVQDTALGWRFVNPRMKAIDGGDATMSLGEATEKLAKTVGISREDADAFALRSQLAAAAAWERGDFDAEVMTLTTAKGVEISRDETVRAETTAEGLAKLRPVFTADGIVTAGNASPLSDGASALIVASERAVERYGLKPRARIVAAAAAGVQPSLFGSGPIPATKKLLDRVGMHIDEIDAIEINEAFAAQVIACQRGLDIRDEQLNTTGGAIALGHPLGSSGARLLVTLLGRLERNDQQTGIASLCIGVGQGMSMLIERV